MGSRSEQCRMYSSGRYFICTGDLYNPKYKEVSECTESIKVLHQKYLPSEAPKDPGKTDSNNCAKVDYEVVIKLDATVFGYVFNGAGLDWGSYPTMKKLILGVNVTF